MGTTIRFASEVRSHRGFVSGTHINPSSITGSPPTQLTPPFTQNYRFTTKGRELSGNDANIL